MPYGSSGVEPVSEEALPPTETIDFARQLLRDGRPFAAHEVFEARWKAGPEASVISGKDWPSFVGITHAERGNRTGALRLVGRAAERLTSYRATDGDDHGLPVAEIIAWIADRNAHPDAGSWLSDHPL